MRRGIVTCLVLIPPAVSLAGCGYDRGDRALSGGLLGAGGGAAIAGIAGGNPGTGALIGGAAGAWRHADQPEHAQSRPSDLALRFGVDSSTPPPLIPVVERHDSTTWIAMSTG